MNAGWQVVIGALVGALVVLFATRLTHQPKRPYLRHHGTFYSQADPPLKAEFGDKWRSTVTGKTYLRTSTGWKLYVMPPVERR